MLVVVIPSLLSDSFIQIVNVVFSKPGTCMGRGDGWKCKAPSRTNFSPFPSHLPRSSFLGAKIWKNFLLYNFKHIFGGAHTTSFRVLFSNQAFTSVFGKICYFLSIYTCDFHFVPEPVPMWIFQLLVLGRSKVIFSHQPTRHLIQLEHGAAFIQKTTHCLWETLPCVTWGVKADWRGWFTSPDGDSEAVS